MAVLLTNKEGWIISHENYIKEIYKNTVFENDTKSYHFNSSLFDIKIPFISKKKFNNTNIIQNSEVEVVRKAYESLGNSYKCLCKTLGISQPGNNQMAKSLADSFYTQETCHPDSNFLGGNSSQEPLMCKISGELYLIPAESFFYCYDVSDISKHLNCKKFDFILMDPPWWNKFIRRKRKKNNKFGYEMVYDKDLSNIPINELLNKDGIIGIWCTSALSHINAVINELFPYWGIEYISQWFWLKITKLGEPICDFSSHSGKQPYERIIFGTKKGSLRSFPNPEKDKVIMSIPSAIHSHKPPLNELLKSYLPNEPKCLEVFARYLLPEWTSYGIEVLKLQHISLYNKENDKS